MGRPKKKIYRPRNKKHSLKFHNAVQKAKASYKYNNQFWLRQLFVQCELKPFINAEIMIEINFHLKCMSSLNSDIGTDTLEDEQEIHDLRIDWHMRKIQGLSPEYYLMIKCQDED